MLLNIDHLKEARVTFCDHGSYHTTQIEKRSADGVGLISNAATDAAPPEACGAAIARQVPVWNRPCADAWQLDPNEKAAMFVLLIAGL